MRFIILIFVKRFYGRHFDQRYFLGGTTIDSLIFKAIKMGFSENHPSLFPILQDTRAFNQEPLLDFVKSDILFGGSSLHTYDYMIVQLTNKIFSLAALLIPKYHLPQIKQKFVQKRLQKTKNISYMATIKHATNTQKNMFPQKMSKQNNLKEIMSSFTRISNTKEPRFDDYLPICMDMVRYFRKDTLHEYLYQKAELQKLLTTMGSFFFSDLAIEYYYDLLIFLRMIQEISVLRSTIVIAFKNTVFFNLQKRSHQISQSSFSVRFKLYCYLLPLQYSGLPFLATTIKNQLTVFQTRLNASQMQMAFKYSAFCQVFSAIDKRIMKEILLQLQINYLELDTIMLLRVMEGLYESTLNQLIHSQRSQEIIKKLQERLEILLDQNKDSSIDHHLLYNTEAARPIYQKRYQLIFQKMMKQLENKQITEKWLKQLVVIVERVNPSVIQKQHIVKIVQYLSNARQDAVIKQKLFKHTSFQLYLLKLLQKGFFSQYIQGLSKIIQKDGFQIYWSMIYQYSRLNLIFPLQPLLAKIKPQSVKLNKDNHYLKTAVAVAIQAEITNQSQLMILKRNCEEKVKQVMWGREHIQWLLKEAQTDRWLVCSYHKNYGKHYLSHLLQSGEKGRPKRPQLFKYWLYFFTCSSVTDQYAGFLLQWVTVECIQEVVQRQLRHLGRIEVNIFLLLGVERTFKQLFRPESQGLTKLIKLLLRYLDICRSDLQWMIVLRSVLTVVQQYKTLGEKHLNAVNTLICRTINLKEKWNIQEYYIHFQQQLSACLDQIIARCDDVDLINELMQHQQKHTDNIQNTKIASASSEIVLKSQQRDSKVVAVMVLLKQNKMTTQNDLRWFLKIQ